MLQHEQAGILLALRLVQGLDLKVEPVWQNGNLIIRDSDNNPHFTINFDTKIVKFEYANNLKPIIRGGIVNFIENSGFSILATETQATHPLEQMFKHALQAQSEEDDEGSHGQKH